MAILNLTQHTATNDQTEGGVVNINPALQGKLKELLTFEVPPSSGEVTDRAAKLVDLFSAHVALEAATTFGQLLAKGVEVTYAGVLASTKGSYDSAMIGGAPFLMAPLEAALLARKINPCYSFSVRVSTEVAGEDGVVSKTNVFKHVSFCGPKIDNDVWH